MNEAPYKLQFSNRALRSLKHLNKEEAAQIIRRLERIASASDVRQEQHKALQGNWRGYFSIRVGDYRAIYQLDHEQRLIFVEKIGNRRDVYDT
jgi:mRNA interferase RelE/StbE